MKTFSVILGLAGITNGLGIFIMSLKTLNMIKIIVGLVASLTICTLSIVIARFMYLVEVEENKKEVKDEII